MDYLHLTSKKNLKSILKYGILPSHIDIGYHWKVFNRDGLEDRKCVYMWSAETYKNTKYIKDMIYTKMFIHPRNKMCKDDHYLDFRKMGKTLYGKDTFYYLLKIHDFDAKFDMYIHEQTPGEGTTVIMDEKYTHEDKPLTISGLPILPHQFDIIERINTRVYKNDTLGFSFSKT